VVAWQREWGTEDEQRRTAEVYLCCCDRIGLEFRDARKGMDGVLRVGPTPWISAVTIADVECRAGRAVQVGTWPASAEIISFHILFDMDFLSFHFFTALSFLSGISNVLIAFHVFLFSFDDGAHACFSF
jgi:hypothetical protein